ncbi:MAG: CotH kinase family protein, partial [Candidatus Kapabacteria bacterium]|nr:CotH kinase family protein [Candidatus Kapabacteria bacterium]
ILTNPDGKIEDIMPAIKLRSDISYGRFPDASDDFRYFTYATPGRTNNFADTTAEFRDSLTFSHNPGYYTEPFDLTIKTDRTGGIIRYTRDGSVPDANSPAVSSPLRMDERTDTPNSISEIKTSRFYIKPAEEINKINVIRAAVFVDGIRTSPIESRSYIVDPQIYDRYKLPIVSLITDSLNLFDDQLGIYVAGASYSKDDPDFSGNYYMRGDFWEKPMHIEFFSPDGQLGFAQNTGVRIHGNMSRRKPQKSFKLYARKTYGEEYFNYKVFPDLEIDKFKRLILRTPTPDDFYNNVMFKDELCHRLLRATNIETQASRAVIVFINGEYWGLHYLRERADQFYIAEHFDIDPDSLTILERKSMSVEGSPYEYSRLLDYIHENDISKSEHYQYVLDQIDVDNFIDYMVAELYFANFDWPMGNIKYWKPDGPYGKWRWIFYDVDRGFIRHSINYIREYTSPNVKYNAHPDWSTFLLSNLMRNSEFRQRFYTSFIEHLNSTFAPETVISQIDSFSNQIAPYMIEHIERWGEPKSYDNWKRFIREMKTFAVRRPIEISRQLDELFGSPFSISPNPADSYFDISIKDFAAEQVRISVYDIEGRSLFSKDLNMIDGKARVDISGLAIGRYIVTLKIGNMVFGNNLIVVR